MPRLGFTFVDVRDVADLHIRAMTDPAGGGERFLATDEFLWISEVAAILRERLGDRPRKVPTRRRAERPRARDEPVRRRPALDRRRPRQDRDLLQRQGQRALGWSRGRSTDSIAECAQSLIDRGVVEGRQLVPRRTPSPRSGGVGQ